MNPYEQASFNLALAAGIVGVLGVIVGVVGLFLAARANGVAKQANKHSKTANDIAAQALGKATEANQIAKGANHLSEESNSLVRRSVAQQEEDWLVDWEGEWNKYTVTLTLANTGRDPAHDVSGVIKGQDFHHVWKWADAVESGGNLTVDLPEIGEKRTAHDEREARRVAETRSSGFILTFQHAYRLPVVVAIRWRTGEGFPASKEIEIELT